MQKVTVVGAGLAGSEAAWQIAQRHIQVDLIEMRPLVMTPAHHSAYYAELVCSNSLRSAQLENAVGLLKCEMRELGSLIMACADATEVPAGGALAVDREAFSAMVTRRLQNHPFINCIKREVTEIDVHTPTIIASGPLTTGRLSEAIAALTSEDYFYFYDAVAPIVTDESLDHEKVFPASRYGRGDDDYLNCPMNREEYDMFYDALVNAETAEMKQFEREIFFEGCMPVEVMAKRGRDTLRFGPLKPVGLIDPHTSREPYAVVQLRRENNAGSLYNLVGFQTHLKWPEQKRVFSMIPGLEQAEFMRYGVMHRNSYIDSPKLLQPTLQLRQWPNVFFAGQITGVEGYTESACSGLVAGINAALLVKGQSLWIFPPDTAHGALCRYITTANSNNFQPMNVNFGLLPPLEHRIKDKKERYYQIALRALKSLKQFKKV